MADLSEYEILRQQNIARNMGVMKALGLDASDFSAHLEQSSGNNKPKKEKKKPIKRKLDSEDMIEKRRSSRILGQSSELLMLQETDNGELITMAQPSRPVKTEAELRGSIIDHDLAEAEHLRWAGKQGKITIVGTASYKHTLMRVRTMNEAGLGRRIKAIERAAGQHAVVKMRLFARVLCLEGYDDLAFDASASLERLINKLGDPEYGPPEQDDDDECKQSEQSDTTIKKLKPTYNQVCSTCTFENKVGSSNCEMCSSALPLSTQKREEKDNEEIVIE
mmetsp:Transcript_12919/g.15434  ORF Transcript_12919/g.15434 Transcript_12919/m.15434 type:complete len:278 (-) Transcript_12919:190-1023(-)